ncbi:MAG: preprotein translocase subunit SecE [Dehalococcoidales bacterium]|nr:preprotein translocase subunit SecE [Dehalococcoidales bacterium]
MAAQKYKTTAVAQRTVTSTKKSFSITGFLGGIGSELKKVVWLSRREVVYLTVVVIIIAGVAGLVLGGVDRGFGQLVRNFFLGG